MSNRHLIYLAAILGTGCAGLGVFGVVTATGKNELKRQVAILRQELESIRAITPRVVTRRMVETLPAREVERRASNTTPRQIAALEATITDLRAQLAVAIHAPAAPQPDRGERGPRGFQQRMDDLRDSDPERYAEIQRRREEFRAHVEHGIARQAAFLLSLDADQMAAEERTNHFALVGLIEDTWALHNLIRERPDTEEGRDARRQIRENLPVLHELMGAERHIVLRQYGLALGFDEDEARRFSDQMQDVFDRTSARTIFGRGMRRGR